VYGTPIMLEDINKNKPEQPVVVSPDVGGVIRARALAKRLQNDTDLAIIDKRRPGPNMAEVMNIIGEVDGKSCLIIDDIVDTAGTLCTAAKALKSEGAKEVKAYCTHPVLSGKALDNLANSELDQLIVTDTIPLTEAAIATGKIRVISLANMLAEAMRRVNTEESLSSMFLD
ncbi:MAG: ribose-phosphate diphosphokinase, partial [Gammaproteobacteria bacterium]|nr:ribose-phosphate diphosphokinase [Gammaproteobacteria bacterium]